MASKNTNKTIFTVAIVAMAGYVVWRMFGSGAKKASAATSANAYRYGVGSGYGSDYYAPEQPQTTSALDVNSLLSSLLRMFSAKSSSGSSGGGFPSSSSNRGYAQNAGSAAASLSEPNQSSDYFVEDTVAGQPMLLQGEANAAEIASQTDASNLGLDSGLSESLVSLPDQDFGGAFITSADNGSSDAMNGVNPISDWSDSTYGGDYGSGLDFTGLDQPYIDLPTFDLPEESGIDYES